MDKHLMTIEEAAPHIGLDRKTLMAWIRSGKCPFASFYKDVGKERGHYIILRERLNAYITAADLRPICPYAIQHPHP